MDLEGDEITTSISKGCFLFKPEKNITQKRKRKRVKNPQGGLSPVDFFQTFSEESKNEKYERYTTFTRCWENLNSQIQDVQNNLNEKIFVELLQFVGNTYAKCERMSPISEIPTAVLVTGVNLPDHNIVFNSFVEQLKESSTPLAVQLQSKDCSSLKFMLKTAFDGLYKCLHVEEESSEDEVKNEDDDDDLERRKKSRNQSVFKDYAFHELITWYKEGTQKENLNYDVVTEEKERIVFILEDFERFQPSVLQDFILICSEHTKQIPIVLLFGVATTVSAVHNALPHAVSTRLSIEKFQAQPSLVCLTEVVDRVLITNQNAFRLGPDVSRLLYEHFLFHDFSIKNFVRALKFCVMEHFSNSPFSVLCTNDRNVKKEYIYGMDDKLLSKFKNLDSVERFIDKKSKSEQTKLKNDSDHFKSVIFKLLKELQLHECTFFPVVKCLHIFASKLPGYPFGKRLRDTYEYCLCCPKITKEKKFETTIALVRMLSRNELQSMLEESVETLRNAIQSEGCECLEKDLNRMVKFLPRFDELDSAFSEANNDNEERRPLTSEKVKPLLYKNRYEMQERMKNAVKEKRKESPFEKLRNEIVDCMEQLFREYIYSPMFMPLHEFFYYNDICTVKKRINGTPRMAHQKALSDPHFYLKCTCCKESNQDIKDTQPDICILYKLHLECGKLINLYDWLQAYITVIDPSLGDSNKKKSKAKKKLEEQLQARFIRGVSELQFLGFIKSTKRKTDHVARLTWGSC